MLLARHAGEDPVRALGAFASSHTPQGRLRPSRKRATGASYGRCVLQRWASRTQVAACQEPPFHASRSFGPSSDLLVDSAPRREAGLRLSDDFSFDTPELKTRGADLSRTGVTKPRFDPAILSPPPHASAIGNRENEPPDARPRRLTSPEVRDRVPAPAPAAKSSGVSFKPDARLATRVAFHFDSPPVNVAHRGNPGSPATNEPGRVLGDRSLATFNRTEMVVPPPARTPHPLRRSVTVAPHARKAPRPRPPVAEAAALPSPDAHRGGAKRSAADDRRPRRLLLDGPTRSQRRRRKRRRRDDHDRDSGETVWSEPEAGLRAPGASKWAAPSLLLLDAGPGTSTCLGFREPREGAPRPTAAALRAASLVWDASPALLRELATRERTVRERERTQTEAVTPERAAATGGTVAGSATRKRERE